MKARQLQQLKEILQAGEPGTLEKLAADLIGKLVGIRFTVARSGFQHGADAGTSMRGGRSLRLECKRYADKNALDDRNLLGEIDHALKHDGALEAWILVSTRAVGQQTEDALRDKSMLTGVPVVIIDWPSQSSELPALAALCAWAPEIVETYYGKQAARKAAAHSLDANGVIDRIERELAVWSVGYDQLWALASARLDKLWSDPGESKSTFGQNIAVGSAQVIPRHRYASSLSAWWASAVGVLAIHGNEGMGKTWATVQWMHHHLVELPVLLLLPASSFKAMTGISHAGVSEFLGNALHDLNPRSQRRFWSARVDRLLDRPEEFGPAFLLLIDGANQDPSYEWDQLLQFLGGSRYKGRVRIVFTSQTHYLRHRLNDLRVLGQQITRLEVGQFDLSKGGELDTLLELNGLSRSSFSDGVVELARTPRLFSLAIRLGEKSALLGEVTRERLLWAHARDELGMRGRTALSEEEWARWLETLARQYLYEVSNNLQISERTQTYTAKDLAEMVNDPASTSEDTARKLQEIVSGSWLERIPGTVGRFRPTEATIHLALGIALLGALEVAEQDGPSAAESALDSYLDPVRATSAAARILTAALSVAVDRKLSPSSQIPRLILSALLHSQNADDEQRSHALLLAPLLVNSLLYVIEDSRGIAGASARHWSLKALRGISSSNKPAWEEISDHVVGWVASVRCPSSVRQSHPHDSASKHEADTLKKVIGTAEPGTYRVLGVPIVLQEEVQEDLGENIPQLFLGKPLKAARKLFVAAAVASTISTRGKILTGFNWLVTLNPIDREELRGELEHLSRVALTLVRESGVSPEMPSKVSNQLLWLTCEEASEVEAHGRRLRSNVQFGYSAYLQAPARAFHPIEYRHLDVLWGDADREVSQRAKRARDLLPDPAVFFPGSLLEEVDSWGASVDVDRLASNRNYTQEDYSFDDFIPAASRIYPGAVARFTKRWFSSCGQRSGEPRHWAALRLPRSALLLDEDGLAAVGRLRASRPASGSKDERIVLMCILQAELLHLPVDEQLDLLVSEADAFISIQLADVLREPGSRTVQDFVCRWGTDDARVIEVLCTYLWRFPCSLEKGVFDRLAEHAMAVDSPHKVIAFMALSLCEPRQFGRFLRGAKWVALPASNEHLQDAGSCAIFSAAKDVPLIELADVVAPWSLLEEAVARGGTREDFQVVANALGRALRCAGMPDMPDVADVSVSTNDPRSRVSIDAAEKISEPGDFSMFDAKAHWEKNQAAREKGSVYLESAKSAGAVMTTRVVSVHAAEFLVEHCPEHVESWLEGLENASHEFVSRINVAGGLFLALCEVLLVQRPNQGYVLWKALSRHLRIKFTGVAKIDELTLMLFRLPESTVILDARREIYCLSQKSSDSWYLDVAVSAISQGSRAWLDAAISSDENSDEPFRRKRAVFISGLIPPEDGFSPAYPEGECVGTWMWLRRKAQLTKNSSHFSRFWWRRYWEADDMLSAYCAWNIFLTSVNKMAWTWLEREIPASADGGKIFHEKMSHYVLNSGELRAAIKGNATKGASRPDQNLFAWDCPSNWFDNEALGPLGY